jgi:hypothetical protein
MVIKYTKIFPQQDPPKFAQIGIFGLKTNHLATLGYMATKSSPPLTADTAGFRKGQN